MAKSNKRYRKGCNLYLRMKNRIEILAEKLMTNKIPEKAWTHLIVNFIYKLLLVLEKNAILVDC